MMCVSPTPTDPSMGAYAALGFVVVSSVYENAITPRPLAVTPIAGYVREAPAIPYVPCMTILLLVGLRMYHAIPARSGLESKLTAVSSAPQSLPLAYITCCIRVSFESGLAITSVPAAWAVAPTSNFQHPVWPLKSSVVSSFKQSPCATSGVVALSAVVPDPGCTCFGGTPYWLTVTRLLLKLSAGDAVLSDDVFVSVQATIWVEVRVPALPETGFCASSAAFELKKYSVPPLLRLNWFATGDCECQTGKPGCVVH